MRNKTRRGPDRKQKQRENQKNNAKDFRRNRARAKMKKQRPKEGGHGARKRTYHRGGELRWRRPGVRRKDQSGENEGRDFHKGRGFMVKKWRRVRRQKSMSHIERDREKTSRVFVKERGRSRVQTTWRALVPSAEHARGEPKEIIHLPKSTYRGKVTAFIFTPRKGGWK